ncbi:hypothetical protein HYR99_06705 [Candidatus Poribacteria bacterium]|nr:hypothetical protein [Candidatus Poribacteria bacterium]
MKKMLGILFVMLIFVCQSLYAATIRVPQDQPTIQAGIDAAVNGDTVLVADGTYTGAGNVNLDFKGKAITVKSVNGAAITTIDCQNVDNTRGFIFQSGETASSVLDGFTITKGKVGGASPNGGGILCTFSSPTINNCIITGNTADVDGGGIECVSSSSPTLTNCTIMSNTAFNGAGMFCVDSSPTLTNCTIPKNSKGGIRLDVSSALLTNCIIAENTTVEAAGGIECNGSSITIINSTITGNTGNDSGGISCSASSSPTIKNTILWGNTATSIMWWE